MIVSVPQPKRMLGPAEFMEQLRSLKVWTGLSYRQLERKAKENGDSLPWSTVATALNRESLPHNDLLFAFVRACGGTAEDAELWVRERRRLAQLRHPQVGADQVLADSPAVPRQLPRRVAGFVDRRSARKSLDELLGAAGKAAVALIVGPAGVGKTALAVQWAHGLVDRFPDGQLYTNLEGYGPAEPAAPAQVLEGFLRALGVGLNAVPEDLSQRIAMFRTIVADRRLLVILDNAADVGQVRPLLPGSPDCHVLVTSRDDLAGLGAHEGARRVVLHPFDDDDGRRVLSNVLGADRVNAEPGPASELVMLCAGLPLALRIAADRVDRRPQRTLLDLVNELRADPSRVDAFDIPGDPGSGLRAVFDWSLRNLPEPASRLFRLLGACQEFDFDAYAVASMVRTELPAARRLLETLAGAHLINEHVATRYTMHDLLREYAADLGASEPDHDAAFRRLLSYRLHTTQAATATFAPFRKPVGDTEPAALPAHPAFASVSAAVAWLDTERPALLAAQQAIFAIGQHEYGWLLAYAMEPYLRQAGRIDDWLSTHTLALDALAIAPDPVGEAEIRESLAWADLWRRNLPAAQQQLETALALRRRSGDLAGEAATLDGLGVASLRAGRFDEAANLFTRALELSRSIGDKQREAMILGNIAGMNAATGRPSEALSLAEAAIGLFRQVGDKSSEARILGNTVQLLHHLGADQSAEDNGNRSVALYLELGNAVGAASSLGMVAWLYAEQGHLPNSTAAYRNALKIGREHGQPSTQADILTDLATVQMRANDLSGALENVLEATILANHVADHYEEARARAAAGEILTALGRPAEALEQRREALALFTRVAAPEAADLAVLIGADDVAR